MLEFFTNFGMGLLGIVSYNVIAFREHIFKKKLVMSKVFWSNYKTESLPIWIWSTSIILLISVILIIAPDVAESLTALTGWDIGTNPASYLSLAFAVSAIKDAKKK